MRIMRHMIYAILCCLYVIAILFMHTFYSLVTFQLVMANSGREFNGFVVRIMLTKRS